MLGGAPAGVGRGGAQLQQLGVVAGVEEVEDGDEEERVVFEEALDAREAVEGGEARLDAEQEKEDGCHIAHIQELFLIRLLCCACVSRCVGKEEKN